MIINELNPTELNIGINALIDETKKSPQWKPMDVKAGDRVAMTDANGNTVALKGYKKG